MRGDIRCSPLPARGHAQCAPRRARDLNKLAKPTSRLRPRRARNTLRACPSTQVTRRPASVQRARRQPSRTNGSPRHARCALRAVSCRLSTPLAMHAAWLSDPTSPTTAMAAPAMPAGLPAGRQRALRASPPPPARRHLRALGNQRSARNPPKPSSRANCRHISSFTFKMRNTT